MCFEDNKRYVQLCAFTIHTAFMYQNIEIVDLSQDACQQSFQQAILELMTTILFYWNFIGLFTIDRISDNCKYFVREISLIFEIYSVISSPFFAWFSQRLRLLSWEVTIQAVENYIISHRKWTLCSFESQSWQSSYWLKWQSETDPKNRFSDVNNNAKSNLK